MVVRKQEAVRGRAGAKQNEFPRPHLICIVNPYLGLAAGSKGPRQIRSHSVPRHIVPRCQTELSTEGKIYMGGPTIYTGTEGFRRETM